MKNETLANKEETVGKIQSVQTRKKPRFIKPA